MLSADLPDTPLASHWPDIAEGIDDLASRLKDGIAHCQTDAQRFAAIDSVLAEHDPESRRPETRIFERQIAAYNDSRLRPDERLASAAEGIGQGNPYFSHPYKWYAEQFGVTRACVHSRAGAHKRPLGLRQRRDKSEQARSRSARKASGSRHNKAARAPSTVRIGRQIRWAGLPI